MVVQLRTQRIGDIGWLLQRQAVLYHEEFRYSEVFERFVARTLPPFLDQFDSKRDRLWVAELDGKPVGAIAIHHVADRPGWAKLRWYFVEKEARGHGIGKLLIEAAMAFARLVPYEGVFLLTVDDLVAARKQYERLGFVLTHEEEGPCPWAPWGKEQVWELRLDSSGPR